MKRIISILAIMMVALVATQAIDAKGTKSYFNNQVINGVRICVLEYRDPEPRYNQFAIGFENQIKTGKSVYLEVYAKKDNGPKTLIYKGWCDLAPGETKLVYDDHSTTKYTSVDVRNVKVIKKR